MSWVLGPIEKAVFACLSPDGTVTARRVAHQLDIAEDEALQGLCALAQMGLADQVSATTYFLTDLGSQLQAGRQEPLPA